MAVKTPPAGTTREAVPFRVIDADGHATELTYSSPCRTDEHDETAVLDRLTWFEPGQPLHNWMLHETDFYDEVEQIWGRRWGAEGIGKLREVLVSRPTENETRGSGDRCLRLPEETWSRSPAAAWWCAVARSSTAWASARGSEAAK